MENSAKNRARILLVEDHASFRQALAFMFEREPEFTVVRQAGSISEARGSLDGVDVAVVDLGLSDGDGTVLIEELSKSEPRVMTLVLSATLDPGRFARAVEAGASGVLHKAVAIQDIVDAVRRLKAGEALLSPNEIVEMLRVVGRERQGEIEAKRSIERAAHPPRTGGTPGARGGHGQPEDLQAAGHHHRDRAHPHGEHPQQARSPLPIAGPGVRRPPRPRRDPLAAPYRDHRGARRSSFLALTEFGNREPMDRRPAA